MSIRIECGINQIATITIDNPARRNALTLAMFQELAAAWPKLAENPLVRAVVVRGCNGSFCSGADLSSGLASVSDIDDWIAGAFLKSAIFPKPIVAAVNGHCVAGGLELALAADIRIVDEDAKIGLPEVRWGIFPSGGAAMKLADQIGYTAAMDLILTGRLIDGRTAARIGLMAEATPSSKVEAVAFARAAAIVDNSPLAVASVKRFMAEAKSSMYAAREAREREFVLALRRSRDPGIGVAAFLSRQQPKFDPLE